MEFWNSVLTEKSWKLLQELKKEKFRFIVIGGWAAYLWTKQHKSKEIEVVSPEALLILKQGAENERGESIKGQKDRIDILTLLCFTEIDFKKYFETLKRNDILFFRQRLKEIVNSFRDVEHLGMNVKDYAKIKKELLNKI